MSDRRSASDRRVTVTQGRSTSNSEHADPLRYLEDLLAKYNAPHVPGLPRFCGGAVGYAGYDTVRYVERLPHPPADDRGLPDLCFALYDRMVIFDHVNKTIAAVVHAHVDPHDPKGSYQAACARVDRLVERIHRTFPVECEVQFRSEHEVVGDEYAVGELRLPEQIARLLSRFVPADDAFQMSADG